MSRFRTLTRDGNDQLLPEALRAIGWLPDGGERRRLVTGLEGVDRVTLGGLAPGVHLVSGVAGVGKSALLVTLARQVAGTDRSPVVLACRHDSSATVARRLVVAASRLDLGQLANATEEHEQRLEGALDDLDTWPLAVLEAEQLQLWAVGAAVERLEQQHEQAVGAVLVDDLDVLAAGTRAGEGGLAAAVAALADLAHARRIAVVVTTAVRDADPAGPGWRPTRRDAAGWAAAAPHLRSAWLLYRDEMYDEDSPDKGIGELILDWQAGGPTGVVKLAFLPHLGLWANLRRPPRSS